MAIDIQEVANRVVFLLGNPCSDVLDDQLLNQIIQDCINEIGDDDDKYCEVVYCSLLETLRFLIRQGQMAAGITGNQRKRKEQNGKRTIEVEYGDSSDVVVNGWKEMYEDFLENPSWVCKELAPSGGTSLVIIGGVSEKEYQRVNDDKDSRNAYQLSVQNSYGYKTTQNVRKRNNLKKWI